MPEKNPTNKKPASKKTRAATKARYMKMCGYIDKHLRREGAHAVGIQRTGKYILWIQRHGAYKGAGFDTFEDWRDRHLRFSADWTRQYIQIGEAFTVHELRGKEFGVHALAAISRMDRRYRDVLLEHGQHHDTTAIRRAYRRAYTLSDKDLDKSRELLRTLLGEPLKGKAPRTAEQITLTELLLRLRRRTAALSGQARDIRAKIDAGERVEAELIEQVRRDLRLAANAMTTLEGALRGAQTLGAAQGGATVH